MKPLFDSNNYLPILNGLVGDSLAAAKDPWAISLSFRQKGKDVSVSELQGDLRGRDTLVFVHGLMANERIWKHFAGLEKDFAVVYVRYNTGLHISENGEAFSKLLHAFQERFHPKSLCLLGHSMGGWLFGAPATTPRRSASGGLKRYRRYF